MAIITILSASHCNEDEIVKKVANETGFEIINTQLLAEASKKFNISEEKLSFTLDGHVSFLNNLTHERRKNTAYLRYILTELMIKDNVIYYGPASLLIPAKINHVLRVSLVADKEFRSKKAMKQENLSEKNAQSKISKNDERLFKWVEYLLDTSPWDEDLYDIVIPMHSGSTNEAVSLITTSLQNTAVQTTPESQKVMEDYLLAARVHIELAKHGHNVEVDNDGGKITIALKTYVIRLGHMKEKLSKIAEAVPGVKSTDVVLGPDVKVPSRYDDLKPPTPKFLLVDDEKEFVQTLSERLRVREFDSNIAYDGEEALSYLEKNQPDVMILDLKMPGIDGMEVLRKVKKERPHVEVIILTGHGSEKDRELALELGAFAYLEKPVNIDVLTKTMKDAYRKIELSKNSSINDE